MPLACPDPPLDLTSDLVIAVEIVEQGVPEQIVERLAQVLGQILHVQSAQTPLHYLHMTSRSRSRSKNSKRPPGHTRRRASAECYPSALVSHSRTGAPR